MRVLLTGHTGFKGSWMTILLSMMGHEVGGIALRPRSTSLFSAAGLDQRMDFSSFNDIRDLSSVRVALRNFAPEVVVHMAAQSLVLDGVKHPYDTVQTNILGTLNVLEAVRDTPSVRHVLIVSTDKVYRNDGRSTGYIESDPLGATDPYSASKAAADLVAQAWAHTLDFPIMTICRAGNVIGGGDDSPDRLVPDVMTSLATGAPLVVRSPNAVRPWQHVLDCLWGYVSIIAGRHRLGPLECFNFGPSPQGLRTVQEVVDQATNFWGSSSERLVLTEASQHEHALLTLDAGKALRNLDWYPRMDFATSVRLAVEWHRAVHEVADPMTVTQAQVAEFLNDGLNAVQDRN